MSEDTGERKPLWRVVLKGAAIAFGLSKVQKARAFGHLKEMSYLSDPCKYEDGQGGRCEPLYGRFTGYDKFKPGYEERRDKDGQGEYRIVFKKESVDSQPTIGVDSIGGRDNVYDKRYAKGRK